MLTQLHVTIAFRSDAIARALMIRVSSVTNSLSHDPDGTLGLQ